MNPGKTQWHRSVTICSAFKELNLPGGTRKWDYHITKSLASCRCSSKNFFLIIFFNDTETKSFKSQFISQICISTGPSTVADLSLGWCAGLLIRNLEVLHFPLPPGIFFFFWFLTTWLLFLQSKPPLLWHPRLLSLNGEQIRCLQSDGLEASSFACWAQSVLWCKQTVSTICHPLCCLYPFEELHGKSTMRDVYPGTLWFVFNFNLISTNLAHLEQF